MNHNKLQLILLTQILCLLFIPCVSFAQSYGVNKIVIDPGHGGKDPGAIGATGLKEKDLVLKIALLTGSYIEKYLDGVEVLYTRNSDTYPTLKERCDFANKVDADLFISIHANAAGNTQAYGSETFILGISKSANNLKVAQKENSVITFEEDYEENYQGFEPNSPESYIIFNFMQSAYQEQSTLLASLIQNQYRDRVGRKDRQVQQGPFWVLSQTSMPAVLTEIGFLSNAAEEKFLKTAQGQEFMASAIFRAVRDYKIEIDAKQSITMSETEIAETTAKIQEAPETLIKQSGIIYKLQIFSSSEIIDKNHSSIKDIEDIGYYADSKAYKYTIGSSPNIDEIKKLKHKYNKQFKGCFIIAFKDGERISIKEAEKLSKNN